MRENAAVGADLYIEDSVSNVKALREHGQKGIVVATSQDEELGEDRAKNWTEVELRVREEIALSRQAHNGSESRVASGA